VNVCVCVCVCAFCIHCDAPLGDTLTRLSRHHNHAYEVHNHVNKSKCTSCTCAGRCIGGEQPLNFELIASDMKTGSGTSLCGMCPLVICLH
jgi:hypothetical protein